MMVNESNIGVLWYSQSEIEWRNALQMYWERVQPSNLQLEQRMHALDINEIHSLDEQGWFDFLYNKYFVWKYTAKNRLLTTRTHLITYVQENRLSELFTIKEKVLGADLKDIGTTLEIAKSINGLGYSGASGLLSLLYPKYFATVDQFVLESLRAVPDLPEQQKLGKINKNCINLQGGILLIEIMRRKANENNQLFNTKFWTPRKIDMVLWGWRRKD